MILNFILFVFVLVFINECKLMNVRLLYIDMGFMSSFCVEIVFGSFFFFLILVIM